ncbi:MAG: DUF1573 domain-containing protein [Tannerellaceae bacterium]|nr:DUF1573 domain-containing protein [Tannerellaceae bacterium]
MQPIAAFILSALISIATLQGQTRKTAEISADLLLYDFGTIAESEEGAAHTFSIRNTGTAPLLINNIYASCGCARPEWPKTPVEPGATAEIKINYHSKGRLGPFRKSLSITSNAGNSPLTLYIKGNVTPKPDEPALPILVYPYSLGCLKLESMTIAHSSAYPGDTIRDTIRFMNDGLSPIKLRTGKLPAGLSVNLAPSTILPGANGEITLSMRTDEIGQLGRASISFPLLAESDSAKKRTVVESLILIRTNILDNYARLSLPGRTQKPQPQYSSSHISFGRISDQRSGSPSKSGKKSTLPLKITNSGTAALLIYSISCDNPLVEISGNKREISPGSSAEYKISIRPKNITSEISDDIYVVSNFPDEPVKLIKVTVEK